MKFKINNAELELDFLDADEMERVEEELDRVVQRTKTELNTSQATTQSQVIRLTCQIVFDFFDAVFGEGTQKRIFGNRCNMADAMRAFEMFKQAKDNSTAEIKALSEKYNPNRAARRANQQVKGIPAPNGNGKSRKKQYNR